MKKLLIFCITMCLFNVLFAGGIVTNSNQSASFVRMFAQGGMVSISAVYYNPAGLTKLNDGIHISVSNQTISQKREVSNIYSGPGGTYGLNEHAFKGTVSAPVFPGLYAAYKIEKFAFSFGFNVVGGGGGATFDKGLPAFEMTPSDLVPSLAAQGATAYRLDAYFKGTSNYFGYQGGISYKINDVISVYGGVRYVTVKNTYLGHLNDVEIEVGGAYQRADAVFSNIVVPQIDGMLAIPGQLQPLITGGAGGLTLAQAQAAFLISASTKATLEAALGGIGVPSANIPFMTIAQIQGTFTAATPTLTAKKISAIATGKLLRDQGADVEQTGSGICPILGVNLAVSEKLNIGLKYEFRTKMELTNKTTLDFTTAYLANGDSVTMFPDGEKVANDMPALLSVGISAKATDKLSLNFGGHFYNDRAANFGKKVKGQYVNNKDVIDMNSYELAAGFEYNITDKLLVSAGYLYSEVGVNDLYQSDLSYSLNANSFGAGGAYKISDKIQVNLGVGYSKYGDKSKWFIHKYPGTGVYIPTIETYKKSNLFFAIGVDLSL